MRSERALPAPAHADERHDLADGDAEVDVAEHRLARLVREAHVVELDRVAHGVELGRVRRVDHLRDRVEQLEDPLRAGEPLLDRVVGADEFLERFV